MPITTGSLEATQSSWTGCHFIGKVDDVSLAMQLSLKSREQNLKYGDSGSTSWDPISYKFLASRM